MAAADPLILEVLGGALIVAAFPLLVVERSFAAIAAEMLPELVRRGVKPDAVTDQTSAHDPINGYLPAGWTLAEWDARRADDPKGVERAAKQSMAAHVRDALAAIDGGLERRHVRDLLQAARDDDLVGIALAVRHRVQHFLGGLGGDRAVLDAQQ